MSVSEPPWAAAQSVDVCLAALGVATKKHSRVGLNDGICYLQSVMYINSFLSGSSSRL